MGSLKKRIPIHKRVNALIDVSAYNVTNSIIFGAPPVNTGHAVDVRHGDQAGQPLT